MSIQVKSISDWEESKAIVDKLELGQEAGRKSLARANHREGNRIHNVDNYEVEYPNINGHELKGYYVYCRSCRSVRQKRIILYNAQIYTVYIKELVVYDKIIEE